MASPTLSRTQPEKIIQNDILAAIGGLDQLFVWPNFTGVGRALSQPSRVVTYGLKGSADILGVLARTVTPEMVGATIGQALAIEVKTPRGEQSEQQQKFQAAFELRGGLYLVARSREETLDSLANVAGGPLR